MPEILITFPLLVEKSQPLYAMLRKKKRKKEKEKKTLTIFPALTSFSVKIVLTCPKDSCLPMKADAKHFKKSNHQHS